MGPQLRPSPMSTMVRSQKITGLKTGNRMPLSSSISNIHSMVIVA